MPVLSSKLYTSDFGLCLSSTINSHVLVEYSSNYRLIFEFYLKDNKLFRTNLLLKETIVY